MKFLVGLNLEKLVKNKWLVNIVEGDIKYSYKTYTYRSSFMIIVNCVFLYEFFDFYVNLT